MHNNSKNNNQTKKPTLAHSILPLNKKTILSFITEKSVRLNIVEQITSTNDYLKTSNSENKKPLICIAEMQTHGRGRFNRKWHSPTGQNIYLSLLYPFKNHINELSGLSLVVGLATCNAITSINQLTKKLTIKWPNDILYDKKKLAGILIEIQTKENSCNAIIGIGINVNMQHANKNQINQKWISLQKITDEAQDRNYLYAELINNLLIYLKQFARHGLKSFTREWNVCDYLRNKRIQITSNNMKFVGKEIGINEQGQLLVKMKNGTIQTFSSGDITILK